MGAGLENVGVEGDPVHDRGDEPGVGEDGSPFAEGEVGGDRDRGAFFAFGDDLEQQFGAARLDLLLLDELGYVQVDPRGAELLFQIITEREERASRVDLDVAK